jgi:hypothetical protein
VLRTAPQDEVVERFHTLSDFGGAATTTTVS